MGSGYSKGVIVQKKIRDERQPLIIKYFTDKLTIKTIAELEKIRNDYKKVYDPLTISPAPLSKIFKKFTDSDIIAVKNIINDGTADINKHMEACARLAADYCVYDIFTKYKNIGSTYYDDIDKAITEATQIKTEMDASAAAPPASPLATRAASFNTAPYEINTVITGINAAAAAGGSPPFDPHLIDVELKKMYNKSAFDVVLTNLIAELNRIKNMFGKPPPEEFKQLKRNVLVAENEITRAKVNPIEQFIEKAKHLPWKIPEVDTLVTKVEKERKEATKSGSASGAAPAKYNCDSKGVLPKPYLAINLVFISNLCTWLSFTTNN